MQKTILTILCALMLCNVYADELRILKEVKQPRENTVLETFSVLDSAIKYRLDYRINKNPETGVETVGDKSTRSTGLGINYAWYANGFLRIMVDGKPLMERAEKIEVAKNSLQFCWGKSTLKLVFPQNSTWIFG